VKIHQKAYFKVSKKKEILEHPWVNYGFAKISKKNIGTSKYVFG